MSQTAAAIPAFRARDGVALCRSVLLSPEVTTWKSRIDAQYQQLEKARLEGLVAVNKLLAPGQRFMPRASSLTIGAALSDRELDAVFATISAGPAGSWMSNQIGNDIACDLDQAWIRRQYAPCNYPPSHAPHGWHQDGALGFDFLGYPNGNFPPDALLAMVTCWIALDPCGTDAPGLEFLIRRFEGLLTPAELTNERVRARFPPDEFWRPVLDAGDALLFRGDILHRTYVTPEMTKDRTSIELHFLPADNIPARLQGGRFARIKELDARSRTPKLAVNGPDAQATACGPHGVGPLPSSSPQ